ncbi:dnaJ homolog subfamily C member 10-like [Amphiura filiformis]|uniref:dnaJ homolog subfamily C member 10-like n=1 Tax=Amphiura filiformis TaxID=82378 RepID=UPI003B20DD70
MATYTTAHLCVFFSLLWAAFITCQVEEQPFVLSFINRQRFQEMVESGEHFLVNFGTIGCIRCKDLEPHYQSVFDHYRSNPSIGVYKTNDINLVRQLGLPKVPAVMLYRHGIPILYEGTITAEDITQWVDDNIESFTTHLKDDDFEHLTQSSTGATTGDWLVKFCDTDSAKCVSILPVWESAAYKLKGQVNVASVNITENPKLAKRFKVLTEDLPVIIFFRHGKQYAYTISARDSASLVTFSLTGYKHAQGIDVMPPPSPFDELTESIALQIKTLTSGEGSSTVLLLVGGAFALIFIVVLFCLCCRGGGGKTLMEELGKTKKSV